jgi:hypothetical protein
MALLWLHLWMVEKQTFFAKNPKVMKMPKPFPHLLVLGLVLNGNR